MLKCVFWDVQHGNAAYIRTPDDQHIVIDLGTGSYAEANLEFSPLLHLKNRWGVQRLDGVIITHPHRDHIDDIFNFRKLRPRVLSRPKHLKEDDIRTSSREGDSEIIDEYLRIGAEYCSPVKETDNPFLADNNGGAQFQKFLPSSCSTSNLNNHSIVTIISYSGLKILIPGDNESPSWNELLESKTFVSAISETDVFVAPHHGRKAGFSSALFEHISPRLVIISDGPSGETSATYQYSQQARGWTVNTRRGGTEKRRCVTTRNDGVIVVDFEINEDGNRFIDVKID